MLFFATKLKLHRFKFHTNKNSNPLYQQRHITLLIKFVSGWQLIYVMTKSARVIQLIPICLRLQQMGMGNDDTMRKEITPAEMMFKGTHFYDGFI